VQRLANEVLTHVGAVRVGGVDEVDAELDRATQHGDGGVVVRRIAPDAVSGDAHRAEAEAANGERIGAVGAEREGSAGQDGCAMSVMGHSTAARAVDARHAAPECGDEAPHPALTTSAIAWCGGPRRLPCGKTELRGRNVRPQRLPRRRRNERRDGG
jgi:hypothetical protein